jgi:hypothetical protein
MVIYMSCSFDGLVKDLDALLSLNDGQNLESTTGYILFPGSNHVETVVLATVTDDDDPTLLLCSLCNKMYC